VAALACLTPPQQLRGAQVQRPPCCWTCIPARDWQGMRVAACLSCTPDDTKGMTHAPSHLLPGCALPDWLCARGPAPPPADPASTCATASAAVPTRAAVPSICRKALVASGSSPATICVWLLGSAEASQAVARWQGCCGSCQRERPLHSLWLAWRALSRSAPG
jgi:hypothetical protein